MARDILEKFKALYSEYDAYVKDTIPLCAAETYVSDFVKQALPSLFEGKYAMGVGAEKKDDFIGSEYIYRLYDLVSEECKSLFDVSYADPRTLSGMNCITTVLMALKGKGMKTLLTAPEHGGHASVPKIMDALQIRHEDIPYDLKNYQIDYDALQNKIKSEKPDMLVFCQSDLLEPPDLGRIDKKTLILYDCTQTLGLITAGVLPNPALNENVIMIGGTHKTLPGPTCGLILTNNKKASEKLKNAINPVFLRNIQPNNIAALLLALLETELKGKEYQEKTIENANMLGAKLASCFESTKCGNIRLSDVMHMAKLPDGKYTSTHQLFIISDSEWAKRLYHNAAQYNVTLNQKNKPLFGDNQWGIRIGTQEITRYGWGEEDLDILAQLICLLALPEPDERTVNNLKAALLNKKTPKYMLEDYFM